MGELVARGYFRIVSSVVSSVFLGGVVSVCADSSGHFEFVLASTSVSAVVIAFVYVVPAVPAASAAAAAVPAAGTYAFVCAAAVVPAVLLLLLLRIILVLLLLVPALLLPTLFFLLWLLSLLHLPFVIASRFLLMFEDRVTPVLHCFTVFPSFHSNILGFVSHRVMFFWGFFFLHGGPHARHTGERGEIKLKMYDLFKSGHGPLPMLVDASRAVFAYVHS